MTNAGLAAQPGVALSLCHESDFRRQGDISITYYPTGSCVGRQVRVALMRRHPTRDSIGESDPLSHRLRLRWSSLR